MAAVRSSAVDDLEFERSVGPAEDDLRRGTVCVPERLRVDADQC